MIHLMAAFDGLPTRANKICPACCSLLQITWENRCALDKKNDCLVSCDGTDYKIQEMGPHFSSHKFAKKSGLRCEICLCILTGDMVWVNGPCPCGKCPDIAIFRESLMSHLDDG